MASQTHIFHMAMTCDGCSKAAKKVLGKIEVKEDEIEIDMKEKLIYVTTSKTSDELLEALKKTGKEITYKGEK